MKRLYLLFVIVLLLHSFCIAQDKQRVFVLTDISTLTAERGEPDDTQSMIRLLMYGDMFDFEGFGATYTSYDKAVHPEYLKWLFDLYGKSQDKLRQYGDYPDASDLKARVWAGNPVCGVEHIGEGNDTELSRALENVMRRPSDRPLWILVWGAPLDLAQALWQLRQEGDTANLKNVNVYAIGDQYDKSGPWIRNNFPSLRYITNYKAFRGMYRGGDSALVSKEWVVNKVRSVNAPLAQAYPIYNGRDPWGAVSGVKEGDTPSFLYLINRNWGDDSIASYRNEYQADFAKRLRRLVDVSPSVMQRVYNEVKTPYKYGVVIEAPRHQDMVDCPSVFRVDGKWMMTYVLFDGRGYETWLAESDDLLHWTTKGKILSFAKKGWDKDQRGGFPALQDIDWGSSYELRKYNGHYWVSYIGSSTPGYEGKPISIGIASTKGNLKKAHQWTTYEKPVMALSDDSVKAWESLSPYKSCIYKLDKPLSSKFVMFYNAAQKFSDRDIREKIGIATSDDLLHWKRFAGNPIFQHDHKGTITGDAQIVRMDSSLFTFHSSLYVMFYYCAHNPERSKYGAYNSFAVSEDLLHWTDWTGEPLIVPSESYDARYAHKSFVVKWNGVVYHFYCAVDKDRHRTIALATSRKM